MQELQVQVLHDRRGHTTEKGLQLSEDSRDASDEVCSAFYKSNGDFNPFLILGGLST